MKNKGIRLLLLLGILIMVNILGREYFLRLDLTEEKQFTLSSATNDILSDLDETVFVKAYFSEDLKPELDRYRIEFRDMLIEYAQRSKGNVEYEFVNPNADQALEQEAMQNGIQPQLVNVREKDQFTQQKVYMGAVISLGEGQEVMPFIGPGLPMEYTLTTSIKKLSTIDKPSIGFVQGYGQPDLSSIGQVVQALSVIFSVEQIDLASEPEIPLRFKAVAVLGAPDSIPPSDLAKLDAYMSAGGQVVVGINAVSGDFQTSSGNPVSDALIPWLAEKGIEVEPSFIIADRCGSVTVQQRQGFFTMNTQVRFPYLPLISEFNEHPATQGLEQVVLQFASPVNYIGTGTAEFTPLMQTSELSGKQSAPLYFNIEKKWTRADFPLGRQTVGGVLSGLPEAPGARLVVFGDADFPVSGQGRINPDNANLLVNTLEWLSDDTGLTALRTKGVSARPIEELEDSQRTLLKYLNFLVPILLAIGYGIFRSQRNRHRRLRRMSETYV